MTLRSMTYVTKVKRVFITFFSLAHFLDLYGGQVLICAALLRQHSWPVQSIVLFGSLVLRAIVVISEKLVRQPWFSRVRATELHNAKSNIPTITIHKNWLIPHSDFSHSLVTYILLYLCLFSLSNGRVCPPTPRHIFFFLICMEAATFCCISKPQCSWPSVKVYSGAIRKKWSWFSTSRRNGIPDSFKACTEVIAISLILPSMTLELGLINFTMLNLTP